MNQRNVNCARNRVSYNVRSVRADHEKIRPAAFKPLGNVDQQLLKIIPPPLMLHPSEVVTPERLLEHVWDDRADPFTNTVRVTVSNLRRKLADAGPCQPIETVVGVGYRLTEVAR